MRIVELQIDSPDTAEQRDFYHGAFGFPVVDRTRDKLVLRAGSTQLAFAHTQRPMAGVYHLAFNIPENRFDEAVRWLRERVQLISDDTGADTFHSDEWNADMVYFLDPAGNIVELIARHTLPSTSEHRFTGESVLCVSEIGIAAKDVVAETKSIAERAQAPIYSGADSDTFTAIGNEHGLFVVVKRGRIWFPNSGKAAEPVPINVVTKSAAGVIRWQFA